ncbi:MAG: alcohol dehydrogenase catalytic domain-containing protein [Planctomycetota bacterium]|jgi:alcohol dehydrogenase
MRALVFDGASVSLERNRPEPRPEAGEAVVRPTKVALSDLDLAICRGTVPFTGTLGQEFVGVVEAVGADVDPTWAGRRVVGAIADFCGECDLCLKGLRTHCRRRTLLGLDGRDGCLADRFTLSAAGLVSVPDPVDDDHAVFAHLLATAVQSSRQLTVEGKPYITVLGDGPLGLLVVQVMARLNASVRLVGSDDRRLALCEKWRIKHRRTEEVGRRADQDVVVDCTGSGSGLELAMQLVRPRGTVMLTRPIGDPGCEQAVATLVTDEIRLVGSFVGPVSEAVGMLERREVDVISLVERRMKLDEGTRVLEVAGAAGALRVIVDI